MALSSRGGRSRFTLALLILTSITVLTLDFRGSSAIRSLRSTASTVFSPVRDAAGTVFSPVGDAWNGLFHYDDVKKENDRLRAQIDQLQGQHDQNAEAKAGVRRTVGPAGHQPVHEPAIGDAQVVAGPLTNFEHTIEIDKGEASGIKVGMPVVTGAGLAGQVAEVQGNHSVIKLLTDPGIVVGVRLTSTGDTGLCHGQGDGKPLLIDAGIDPKWSSPPTNDHHQRRRPRDLSRGDPHRKGLQTDLSPAQLTQLLTVTPAADLTRLSFVKVLIWEPAQ